MKTNVSLKIDRSSISNLTWNVENDTNDVDDDDDDNDDDVTACVLEEKDKNVPETSFCELIKTQFALDGGGSDDGDTASSRFRFDIVNIPFSLTIKWNYNNESVLSSNITKHTNTNTDTYTQTPSSD